MKITNYFPFIRNTKIWPHLFRLFRRKLSMLIFNDIDYNDLNAIHKMHANEYLKSVSVSPNEALRSMGINKNSEQFYKKYHEIIKNAELATSKVPYKLGGAANLSILYHLLESINATKVVETGVAYGWSSLSILLSINKRPDSKLWSIVLPYVDKNNSKWVGCAVPAKYYRNWNLIRCADRDGFPKALKKLVKLI